MRTTSDRGRRLAEEALYTGKPRSEEARQILRDRTGVDLGGPTQPIDPETARGNVLGALILAAILLLAAPLYVAARGLWMTEPALKPHDVDTDLLIGFGVFALATLGLYLTAARRIHPLAALVAVGTVLCLGLLPQASGWAMAAFLLAELAFLAAWAAHRRKAAKNAEKVWKMVRDWVVLILCALILLTFMVPPDADDLADAGRQLVALTGSAVMARAGEIAAPLGLPGLAVAAGIPAALALLYVPLTAGISKVMRWG